MDEDERRSLDKDVDLMEEALRAGERLYPPGTPGYERLLAHARGEHGTKPGTMLNPQCEACQKRINDDLC
jgi:hypothetical protein